MKIVFGAIYLILAIIFVLNIFLNQFSQAVILIGAVYLIAKGIITAFTKYSPISTLDSVAGFYFLFVALEIFSNNIVTIIFLLFLVQKGMLNIFRGFH